MALDRNRCIHSKWDVNQQRSIAIPLPYVNMILQGLLLLWYIPGNYLITSLGAKKYKEATCSKFKVKIRAVSRFTENQ
jgi:hypothetical protein